MYNMKTSRKVNPIIILMVLSFLIGCKNKNQTTHSADDIVDASHSEEELYRPNFHFTPKKGWMNDPNGMFHYNGYYHLYFQHYPDGNKWGPMHWGHTISTDMVSWKEQPIALYPADMGVHFFWKCRSGSGKYFWLWFQWTSAHICHVYLS